MRGDSVWQSRPAVLACVALVLLTLLAYYPVWDNGFIDLDDSSYITDNPHVLGGLTGANLAWAWTTVDGGYWQPLTWMSLQLDATLFSQPEPGRLPLPSAAGFHATNLFWHTATTV